MAAELSPEKSQLCKVCGEPAAGFHFGAFTCEGCKSFFGRSHNNASSIGECKYDGRCVINRKTRTLCKKCRLRKCLMVGMSKTGSRYGRRSNWFKIHFLMQGEEGKLNENQSYINNNINDVKNRNVLVKEESGEIKLSDVDYGNFGKHSQPSSNLDRVDVVDSFRIRNQEENIKQEPTHSNQDSSNSSHSSSNISSLALNSLILNELLTLQKNGICHESQIKQSAVTSSLLYNYYPILLNSLLKNRLSKTEKTNVDSRMYIDNIVNTNNHNIRTEPRPDINKRQKSLFNSGNKVKQENGLERPKFNRNLEHFSDRILSANVNKESIQFPKEFHTNSQSTSINWWNPNSKTSTKSFQESSMDVQDQNYPIDLSLKSLKEPC